MTDEADATRSVLHAGSQRRSYAVTALATHGLMESVRKRELRDLVNTIDLVTPDGQPVRWAMNMLHGVQLRDVVFGPDLMVSVCREAARRGIPVYLFGSTEETITTLAMELKRRFPELEIAGMQADRFREATPEEDEADVERINSSGAGIVFVGRGCPRQEQWVATHRGRVHAAMLAVGAAFDYLSNNLTLPPAWVQRWGLAWLHRLVQEPSRLWRRYAVNNTLFLVFLAEAVWRNRHGQPRAASVERRGPAR